MRFPCGGLAVVAALLLLTPSPAAAQAPDRSPFRTVDPVSLPLDRDGVWTLHFAYLPVRITTVDVPGVGPRRAWYMVYRVWNTSDTPVEFIPQFELVTKDGKYQTFLDEPHPSVVKQIREREDPTGALNLQTSVSIFKNKIPVTKVDSIPRAVHGVAVWLDVPEKAAGTNNFSVYVAGLSNGLATAENDAAPDRVSVKTLQLDFIKPTDNARPQLDDIRVNDNNGLGAEKWIYRVAPVKAAAPAEKTDDKKDEGK
jgi:hypothetical protein